MAMLANGILRGVVVTGRLLLPPLCLCFSVGRSGAGSTASTCSELNDSLVRCLSPLCFTVVLVGTTTGMCVGGVICKRCAAEITCVLFELLLDTKCGEHTPFSRGERREVSSLTMTPLLTCVSMGDVRDRKLVGVVVGMTMGMCEFGPICTTWAPEAAK